MRVFVDTNILLDYVCNREGFAEDAIELFLQGFQQKHRLIISDLSYVNTVYIGRKYEMDNQTLLNSLKRVEAFSEVAQMNSKVIHKALHSNWSDFEDSVQYFSALESMADCIVTRNKKDYKESTIPVYGVKDLIYV